MIRMSLMLAASGLILAQPAAAGCSATDLIQKQKAFSEAVKAAFERDPSGDSARQARVREVIGRYGDLKKSRDGSQVIDLLCKENDELIAIYK